MCAVDAYDKDHVPIRYDASSGGGRPMPITSSKESLISIGHKINFIYNWLQLFEDNYDNRIMIHKIKMSELFKTILNSLPPNKIDDYFKKK